MKYAFCRTINPVRIEWFILLLFVVIIPFNSYAYNSEINSSHLASVPCNQCHQSSSNISPETAGLLVAPQATLCSNCHAGAADISHPFDFSPGSFTSAELPLNEQNKMTCSTCHDVHGKSDGLLRTEKRGIEFCQLCHKQDFFLAMKDQGTSLITSTHLNTKKYNNSTGLDNFSIQCLGCHNDDNYSSQNEIFENSILHQDMMSGNHQIGVVYASYQTFGGYKPQEMLDENINLPQGKLSCISCHKSYSKNHGSLVMGNSGSSLCYGCHEI